MILTLMFLNLVVSEVTVTEEVQKEIRYQKETTVDLSGAEVQGESQFPPAFFLTKMQTPKAGSLLAERLRFGLKDYNRLGF